MCFSHDFGLLSHFLYVISTQGLKVSANLPTVEGENNCKEKSRGRRKVKSEGEKQDQKESLDLQRLEGRNKIRLNQFQRVNVRHSTRIER